MGYDNCLGSRGEWGRSQEAFDARVRGPCSLPGLCKARKLSEKRYQLRRPLSISSLPRAAEILGSSPGRSARIQDGTSGEAKVCLRGACSQRTGGTLTARRQGQGCGTVRVGPGERLGRGRGLGGRRGPKERGGARGTWKGGFKAEGRGKRLTQLSGGTTASGALRKPVSSRSRPFPSLQGSGARGGPTLGRGVGRGGSQ